MKKLFGIMFAGYVALLNAVAYAQQGMTQEMADNLNARNEDQSAFMIIWFMILENWLLILAVLVLLIVVLLMMRRHDRMNQLEVPMAIIRQLKNRRKTKKKNNFFG